MAKIKTVKCDECGVIKGESNHWLEIDISIVGECPMVIVSNVEPRCPSGYERHDLCGQACFHKHLDTLLFPSTPKPLRQSISQFQDPTK